MSRDKKPRRAPRAAHDGNDADAGAGTKQRLPIVGIGASAGGLEAFTGFFKAMPPDSGMGFVLVAHLDPTRTSMLPEILARHTRMPVLQAIDDAAVEPNHVYVIPPDAVLTIEQGRLRVRHPQAPRSERTPIDIFFAALAEDQGHDAIAIVLSGSGSDGTLGIKAVKEFGGLTLVQGGDGQAKFKDMPMSAVATGLVDLVLPVEKMPEKLLAYARSLETIGGITSPDQAASPGMRTIYTLLRNRTGHDFSQYKTPTFGRRIKRRMQVLQLEDLKSYVERLRNDAQEAQVLLRDLLIGVTSFFRDADAFKALETDVLPKIFMDKSAGDTVRVWVAGCATGEEAYSLAIMLREQLDHQPSAVKAQVFATDIDEHALALARAGLYPAPLLKDLSPERLSRGFSRDGSSYRVSKELREMCIFSSHSLIKDPPFSRLDLICCRNLLIYLNTELQAQIIPLFHYALNPGGFLFLGNAENVSQHAELFAPIDGRHRIFQRRDLTTRPALDFPSTPSRGRPASAEPREPTAGASATSLVRTVEAMVLDKYAPAFVVVNDNGDVVHYSAHTGPFLEAAVGPPSRQLLAMVRKGLRLDLRAAFSKAMESGQSVTRDHVAFEIEGKMRAIDLTVQPVITHLGERLFTVIFSMAGGPRDGTVPGEPPTSHVDATAEQLERELHATKERLQTLIEELETSNEELKSTNEELLSVNEEMQSTNEELETSKEELQSVNEELHTVNLELSQKVEELDRANSDLRNLFESTPIAIIFLDPNLAIRSFTPAVAEVFHLIPSDSGRPLTDIVSRLDYHDLARDLRSVLVELKPIERQVRALESNNHYLMRILPYRVADNRVDGVLVTFVNVSNMVPGASCTNQE